MSDKWETQQAAIEAIRTALEGKPVITREGVEDVTDGAVGQRRLANLDCAGKGIPDGFYIGRKKCYLTSKFLSWLEDRLEA